MCHIAGWVLGVGGVLCAGDRLTAPAASAGVPVQSAILVLLDLPTRWDAWVATGGAAAARDGGGEARPGHDASSAQDALRAAATAAEAIGRATAPVAARVADDGGLVLARYDTALAGLLVRGPAGLERGLAALPQVRAVTTAPQLVLPGDIAAVPRPVIRPARPVEGPADPRAKQVAHPGAGGAAATIAVVDSGIDYTHAAFGGPGTEVAYLAARRHAETVEDLWAGRPLYPTAKVIGGWDFAGPRYDPSCPAAARQRGDCSGVPEPDPDPLDTLGHGTHVAGSAAGEATAELPPGGAPGARLVALKIFGAVGTTDLVVDPLEWAIEANMGLDDRPHIDVLNLSFGKAYGAAILDEAGALERALDAGIVVVASAGNDGDLPFVVSAPGTAPPALAVASFRGPSAELDPLRVGEVSAFSSRGPSRLGTLKPDVSAPGEAVRAAAMGQGGGAVAYSGTSHAAPQVAGAAAVVWSAARATGRPLAARDVGAILMNTADPSLLHRGEGDPATPPVSRTGAGAVDAVAAAAATTVVRAGPLASLNLGLLALTEPITRQLALTLTNLADTPRRYRLASRFREPEAAARGLEIAARPALVDLEAGHTATVTLAAHLTPGRVPAWQLAGGEAVASSAALTEAELDGWIQVEEANPDATGVTATARVPFYALARRASAITAGWEEQAGDAAAVVRLANSAPFTGTAELYRLVADDAAEAGLLPKVDLDAVGARARPDGQGGTIVELLLHTRGRRMVPAETQSVVELDTDLDGGMDFTVTTADEGTLLGRARNGKVAVALAPRDVPFGQPTVRYYAGVDFDGRTTVLPIRIEDTGLTPSRLRFNFRVWHGDGVESSALYGPQTDRVPEEPGWLSFDGRPAAWRPERWSVSVPGGEPAALVATLPGDPPDVLILCPQNAPGDGDLLRLVHVPPPRPPGLELVLPYLSNGPLPAGTVGPGSNRRPGGSAGPGVSRRGSASRTMKRMEAADVGAGLPASVDDGAHRLTRDDPTRDDVRSMWR
jgi:subtilisin family serine protease